MFRILFLLGAPAGSLISVCKKSFASCFLAFFYSLCFLTTVYGQKATLSGIVVDEAQNIPVEFASISLHSAIDSTPLSGTITNEQGKFILKDLKDGDYFLTAKFLGFAVLTVKSIHLNKDAAIDLGILTLTSDKKLLDEVVVTGSAVNNLHKIDKQVYKASQFQSAQGGTALDILRNTPAVTVNAEGDISMRGSSGFLILLNGKPVQTDPKTFLNQLPANTIENLEIVTAPSAKYDPDGKSGIINITTKQGTLTGWAFAANAQGGFPSIYTYNNLNKPIRFGGDFTLNYKKGKWDFVVSANYLRNDISGRRVGQVSTKVNDIYTSFPSDGERSFKRYNYTGRASLAYAPDKNNSISAGIYNGHRYQLRRADIVYHNTRTDLNTSNVLSELTYFNSNLVEKSNDIVLGNLDYLHAFTNKSTLSLTALYEHSALQGETDNLNLAEPDRSVLLQQTVNPSSNPLNAFRVKGGYGIKLDSGQLNIGYQYRYQIQEGIFKYLEKNNRDAPFIVNPAFSSSTRVTNTIHSIYAEYAGRRKKWEYVGGLRFENAFRSFIAGSASARNLNLNNIFPSLTIQYAFTKTFRLKTSYSRRVQRGTINELNPYPEREHSETLEKGDPTILPEFIDLAELGVVKEFSAGNVFATLYHQRIQNIVNRVNSVYNDTILYRIFTNAGRARSWGLEAGATLKPFKWWQVYVGGNLYNYQIKGALFNELVPVNTSSNVYSINANTSIKLSSSLTFQWNINYLSQRVTAQGRDSRFLILGSSLKKVFMKGKFSAMLQWQNMDLGLFGTNQQTIATWGSDFYTSTNYIQETDMFLLNLNFNINQLTKKSKLPVSEFGEKEF